MCCFHVGGANLSATWPRCREAWRRLPMDLQGQLASWRDDQHRHLSELSGGASQSVTVVILFFLILFFRCKKTFFLEMWKNRIKNISAGCIWLNYTVIRAAIAMAIANDSMITSNSDPAITSKIISKRSSNCKTELVFSSNNNRQQYNITKYNAGWLVGWWLGTTTDQQHPKELGQCGCFMRDPGE